MAKFEEGNKQGVKIDGELAAEYQRRSVESRKANTSVREVLLHELMKKARDGEDMTRLEALVVKAMSNHAKGKLTFKDLKDLQDLLGESIQNVNVKTDAAIVPMTPEAIDALNKWTSKDKE